MRTGAERGWGFPLQRERLAVLRGDQMPAERRVVLLDINMPRMNGIELTRQILGSRPDLPVVVITAFGSMESAVAAMRAGAYDFVTKPLEIDTLALVLQRAVQHRALREEVKLLRQVVASAQRFEEMLGESTAMRRMLP